ncbi:hypothetical protein EDD18DRAFT_1208288 [Armillaria luteobubalina]|uniref:Uncharacterized protein n=1 Tax=Armillaria luteobubalina TaxID=153913 RepID=A0AA39P6T2_9AGAR|nr:hypothetical protein EDD18DRAFT_1208288 [Armillaria luteobubalina]
MVRRMLLMSFPYTYALTEHYSLVYSVKLTLLWVSAEGNSFIISCHFVPSEYWPERCNGRQENHRRLKATALKIGQSKNLTVTGTRPDREDSAPLVSKYSTLSHPRITSRSER